MHSRVTFSMSAAGAAVLITLGASTTPVAGQAGTGTIVGHVKYVGPTPVNPIVRLGADPRCVKLYVGKRLAAPTFAVAADGGMGSVFVDVDGPFPNAPASTAPAVVEQKDCVYAPHVIGARIGQTLQVRNDDITGHNVHSLSMAGNEFNTSQPTAGMVFEYRLKAGEMLHLKCDTHTWMSAYVAIVDNPYFAVTGTDGSFTIANVPVGTQTIKIWHEVMGPQMQTVNVQAGKTTTVDVSYMPLPKPVAAAGVHELLIPAEARMASITVLR
jgi:plastocyanin